MIGWGIFSIVLGTIGFICSDCVLRRRHDFRRRHASRQRCNRSRTFLESSGMGARTAAIILALLTAVTGLILMFYPIFGAETLTLFLASYFVAVGLVKCWIALSNTDTKGWGLMLFSAVVSFLLGICLWVGLAAKRTLDLRYLCRYRIDLRWLGSFDDGL